MGPESERKPLVAVGEDNGLTHYKKAPRLRGPRKLAIPSRGILAERSSSSRVRFAAKNALLTAAGRSAHFSAKKECEVSGPPQY